MLSYQNLETAVSTAEYIIYTFLKMIPDVDSFLMFILLPYVCFSSCHISHTAREELGRRELIDCVGLDSWFINGGFDFTRCLAQNVAIITAYVKH